MSDSTKQDSSIPNVELLSISSQVIPQATPQATTDVSNLEVLFKTQFDNVMSVLTDINMRLNSVEQKLDLLQSTVQNHDSRVERIQDVQPSQPPVDSQVKSSGDGLPDLNAPPPSSSLPGQPQYGYPPNQSYPQQPSQPYSPRQNAPPQAQSFAQQPAYQPTAGQPQQSYPPQQGYPPAAQQQGYPPQQQQGYPPAAQQGYPAAAQQQQAYPPRAGYPPAAQQGYPPAAQQGYPAAAQQGYAVQGYPPAAQQGYPAQQGYYQGGVRK